MLSISKFLQFCSSKYIAFQMYRSYITFSKSYMIHTFPNCVNNVTLFYNCVTSLNAENLIFVK